MGNYTYPGVYVQEVDTGNKPIEGVSTSIAGFLGIAERGPLTATFLTSYADYQRTYGSYYVDGTGAQTYLAYAVEGFFLNGGQGCWVARVAPGKAVTANATLANMTISAAGPGATGSQIGYQINAASTAPSDTSKFMLLLYYWPASAAATKDPTKATLTEVFDNLSTSPSSSMYFVGTVNSGSNLVTVAQAGKGTGPVAQVSLTLLTGPATPDPALTPEDFKGSDTDPANLTGLAALDAIDDISIYCCPDEYYLPSTTSDSIVAPFLVASCQKSMDRFAILQSKVSAGAPAKVSLGPGTISLRGYSAFYYPWLSVTDPTTSIATLIPPGGHIAGIYARSDMNYSVAKDPANEQILGIDSIQFPINNGLQGQLNPIGVNCLRYFKKQGNLVYGGRTTSPDPDWQYINVRRLFIFIEKSIQQGTQWVVFQPNDRTTWARVVRSVSDFLTGLWMQDMLMGATKDKAFFVRCDETTMTQTDIESGRLIVLVGVAPVFPAEFVIFRIGQWSGGASVTEV
jgi:phage tail sheath protein FI